jgi:magnesium chelatase subunit H
VGAAFTFVVFAALYNAAARKLAQLAPHIQLRVFSDRDVATRKGEVAAAMAGADCFFGSLLFDYDTVEWLRAQLKTVPVVLVFESALELMGMTQIGSFAMDPSGVCVCGGGGANSPRGLGGGRAV